MDIGDFVFKYRADISDIQKNVRLIQRINATAAKKLGVDFSKGFSVVNDQLKKVQFDKKFKINIEGQGVKKVTGTINTFEKTLQSADGRLFKFTETVGVSEKGNRQLSSSLVAVAQAQNKLIGTSSKLTTNFQSSADISTAGAALDFPCDGMLCKFTN